MATLYTDKAYEEAKRRIEEWKKGSPSETLDFSRLSLMTLPPLPSNVLFLTVRHCYLTSLPELPETLLKLDCYCNPLTELPTLPPNLKCLDVCYSKIKSLPELPPTLTHLYVDHSSLVSLPPLPSSLLELSLNSTRITKLPSLHHTNIRILALEYMYIRSLPKLPDSLWSLNICGSYVQTPPLTLPPHLGTFDSRDISPALEYFPQIPRSCSFFYPPTSIYWLLPKNERDGHVNNRTIVNECIKQYNQIKRQSRFQKRCKAVKEELMEKTWHPNRYLEWCIDEEERQEWKQGETGSCSNAA